MNTAPDASWRNVQLCDKTKQISWIYKRSTKLFLSSPHSALEQIVIEMIQTQILTLAGDHRRSDFSLSDIKAVYQSDEDRWRSWGLQGEEWGENQVKCRHHFIALLVHVLCLTAETELCCLLFMLVSQPLWFSSEWNRSWNIGASSTDQGKLEAPCVAWWDKMPNTREKGKLRSHIIQSYLLRRILLGKSEWKKRDWRVQALWYLVSHWKLKQVIKQQGFAPLSWLRTAAHQFLQHTEEKQNFALGLSNFSEAVQVKLPLNDFIQSWFTSWREISFIYL